MVVRKGGMGLLGCGQDVYGNECTNAVAGSHWHGHMGMNVRVMASQEPKLE